MKLNEGNKQCADEATARSMAQMMAINVDLDLTNGLHIRLAISDDDKAFTYQARDLTKAWSLEIICSNWKSAIEALESVEQTPFGFNRRIFASSLY